MNTSTDRIERKILLKAPRARVWRALSNAEEFGNWFGVTFGVDLKGNTFTAGQRVQGQVELLPCLYGKHCAGQRVQGQVTCQGYEHVGFDVTVEQVEPERLLSWRWHPAPIDPTVDYSQEPTTLVMFELEEVDGGTLLTVIESGLDKIPASRRLDAFRMNSNGWDQQLKNIENHVTTSQHTAA